MTNQHDDDEDLLNEEIRRINAGAAEDYHSVQLENMTLSPRAVSRYIRNKFVIQPYTPPKLLTCIVYK
jgi:hypothetical protein